jgi:hypothetical protein
MGRPKKEVDWVQCEKLCALHCTRDEIADVFDMSADTLEARIREKYDCTFSAYFKQKSSGGKRSLRRKQYETAMSGNVTMQIWLGKQWLGQSDKSETKHDLNDANNKLIVNIGKSEKE